MNESLADADDDNGAGFDFVCRVSDERVLRAIAREDSAEAAAASLIRAIKRQADDMRPRLTARLQKLPDYSKPLENPSSGSRASA